MIIILGIICLGEPAAAVAKSSETNCTTKYLELDIDITSDQPPSCNATEMIMLQELLSHVVNKRFGIYGNETEGVLDIAMNGVCPTSNGYFIEAGSDRLLRSGGLIYTGGPQCKFCNFDDYDTGSFGFGKGTGATGNRMLRKRQKYLTAEEQIEKLKKRLEKQLGRMLTRKVNHNHKSCLAGVGSTVSVDITPMDEPPTVTCLVV